MGSVYQDKKYMGSAYKEESIWEVYIKKKVYGRFMQRRKYMESLYK